jgi:hypothetical protein
MIDSLKCGPPPLWRLLDLILEAHAVALDLDPEVAGCAMMTALALGERLGLSDSVVYRMAESAAGDVRRRRIMGRSTPGKRAP